MTTLECIAPRLGRAYRERLAEMATERAARRRMIRELLQLEWMVAHRELQLLRAQATGSRKYIAERQRKLEHGRRRLARAQARAKDLP